MAPEAFFLPVAGSGRFCLLHRPSGEIRGAILYLHPLAEELNRSRRIATLQARDFAAAGYLVLQIDLQGCGDSAGEFADASWQQWLTDTAAGIACLRSQSDAPLYLWGVRCGALLAVEAAARLTESVRLLLWQPPVSGRQHLQQFLRLAVAAGMLVGRKVTTEVLSARLTAGETLEIAGYGLSPALAQGLAEAQLAWPANLVAAHCLEVGETLSPALAAHVAANPAVSASAVPAVQFWQAPGVDDVPALRQASLEALKALEALTA